MTQIKCYNCNKEINKLEGKRWYHGDQDDLVCKECAKTLKHTDTSYSGTYVSEEVN